MADVSDLYTRLLGIASPWHIESVDLDEASQSVLVRVAVDIGSTLICPICGESCPGYDLGSERRWRHLDSCGWNTYLLARMPRIHCAKHKVRTISAPWSEPHSRFTMDFERFAIMVLQQMKCQSRAAKILDLSLDQVHDIMARAVERGMARRSANEETPVLTLDEKGYHRGKNFVSILTDVKRNRVLDVVQERSMDAVGALIEGGLTPEQRKTVQCVTMDMWDGFVAAVEETLPDADIVFDRFHIARYLNQAVDQTRIEESKRLSKIKADSLKGSKFFWVTNPDNLRPKVKARFSALLESSLETAKAFHLKDLFRSFFAQADEASGKEFFDHWAEEVVKLRNPHLLKVLKMLQRYYRGISNYLKHRATNSAAEGMNARIQEIKTNARGYRTFQGFRTAILFFLGQLDLNPLKCR